MLRELYFFIGTEAEIMKMFTVIRRAKEAGFVCKVVSSGQNDIKDSPFLALCDSKIDVDFSMYRPIHKTGVNQIKWLLRTLRLGRQRMRKLASEYPKDRPPVLVVHGDTSSTLMGAMIARWAGMPHVHVEGGLRSYHWLNPFPEEIDRYFSSRKAEIVFCPSAESAEAARRSFRGEAVDTVYNTNIETLQYARRVNGRRGASDRLYPGNYFVVALHRQENLISRKFMAQAVHSIGVLAKKIHCVFICHEQTRVILEKYGLLETLENDPNITMVPRMAYLDFIDAVDKAEFLAADGAGNQQEMYYMGKPYLILRGHFEKQGEGQGYNCVGYNGDFRLLERFDQEYPKYRHSWIEPETLPSEIIVKKLLERYGT